MTPPTDTPPTPARPSTRLVSLGTKLALATLVVLGIVSTALFIELTGRERQGLVRAKQMAASMVADLFAASLSAPLDFGDNDAIEAELRNVESNADITCARVWQGAGSALAGQLERGGCDGIAPPAAAEQGTARVLFDRVVVARTVLGRGRAPIGSAVVVFSLAPENAAFAASRRRIFWLSFALAAVTALALIALARRLIVTPIAQLRDASRRIGRGELGAKVTFTSNDEIGELASAFNGMSEQLADRERRLEAATQSLRDLFDHMRQAILAFGPDGKVQGAVSRAASTILAAEARASARASADLEGHSIRSLLYPGVDAHDVDLQAFDEWLAMAFQISLEKWDELAALAPHEVILKRPGKRSLPLELEFRPIVKKGAKDGAIERVMLLATDVSERRKLEETVQTQEEEHARRMAAMRRLIAGGGQVFVAFMDAARERLARCNDIVGMVPRMLRTAEIDELFRHVHTIKGEARAFDLRDLESETGKLEEELDELRAAARGEGFATTGSVHGLLMSRLHRTRQAIDNGSEVFVAASPIGRAALDQVTVQRSEVNELLELIGTRDDAISRVAARLASRPFGESTASLIDMTPTWGEKEGKRASLDVEGREVRIPPALARVLGGVLTHLVRNALAHGVEPPSVREEAGKPAAGVIRIVATDADDGGGGARGRGPQIVVEDDGRGLDLERLAERGMAMGAKGHGPELAFAEGLTTQVTTSTLAGRGVGLAAVRADLASVGYEISVTSDAGHGARFVLRPRSDAEAPGRLSRPPHAAAAAAGKP